MLTPKENALRMIYDEKPEYIPMTFEAFRIIGMPLAPALEAPLMQTVMILSACSGMWILLVEFQIIVISYLRILQSGKTM